MAVTITLPESIRILLNNKGIKDIESFVVELIYKYIEECQALNKAEELLIEENLKGLGYI